MPYRQQTLEALARLLSYPTDSYVEAAELLYVILQSDLPEAAQCMADFGAYVEPRVLHELEENFARTFDINPACALEVGWHLFGEEYARGLFLVRLRGEMRERGLEESAELPDHIAHVLALVAAMPDDEARRFVQPCVLPAVDRMQKALDDAESPYRHVIRCLALVLERQFGRGEAADSDVTQPKFEPRDDLLRDFPMPCSGCEPVELVQLDTKLGQPPEAADVAQPASAVTRDDSSGVQPGDTARQGDSHG